MKLQPSDSIPSVFRFAGLPMRIAKHLIQLIQTSIKKLIKVVRWATENNLNIIIDMHHYDELFIDPAGHSDRFVALWQQLAEHYKDQPDSVFFELINEPHNKLTNDIVEPLLTRTLAEVRKTNPTRKVIMGGAKAGAGLSRWRHLIRRKTPMSSPPSIFINHSTSPIRVQAGSIHRHQRQPASAVMKIMRGSTK